MLFDVSYLALCVIVVIESAILRAIVADTLWLARLYEAPEDDAVGPALGTPMPAFQARLVDAPDVLTDKDLRSRSTMLFFVTPAVEIALTPGVFLATLFALWNKTEGALQVVCSGSEEDCRLLRDHYQLRERFGDNLRLVLDHDSDLATRFGVPSTPVAVLFDESGLVRRVGRPDPEAHLRLAGMTERELHE